MATNSMNEKHAYFYKHESANSAAAAVAAVVIYTQNLKFYCCLLTLVRERMSLNSIQNMRLFASLTFQICSFNAQLLEICAQNIKRVNERNEHNFCQLNVMRWSRPLHEPEIVIKHRLNMKCIYVENYDTQIWMNARATRYLW